MLARIIYALFFALQVAFLWSVIPCYPVQYAPTSWQRRMLDGLSLVMISYGVYTYLVIDYMDPTALETVNRCVASFINIMRGR